MVFSYWAGDHSEYLTWTIHDYRFIFGIRWNKSKFISLFFKVFECYITIERSDHDVSILRSEGPIEDDDISLPDPGILHTVTLHFHEVSTRWMLDKILLQIHLTRRMRLRSKWKSCPYWLEEWISCESVCRCISLILEEEYPRLHELLEKELDARTVGIPEELSHLIERAIDSSIPEKGPEEFYFLIVIFVDSHSIMYKCTLKICIISEKSKLSQIYPNSPHYERTLTHPEKSKNKNPPLRWRLGGGNTSEWTR